MYCCFDLICRFWGRGGVVAGEMGCREHCRCINLAWVTASRSQRLQTLCVFSIFRFSIHLMLWWRACVHDNSSIHHWFNLISVNNLKIFWLRKIETAVSSKEFTINHHSTCVADQTRQQHQELQHKDAEHHPGFHWTCQWRSHDQEQQDIPCMRQTNNFPLEHYCHLVESIFPCISRTLSETYLWSAQKTADVSFSASVWRSAGSLCSWPCCGGALCMQYRTIPATTIPLSRTGWRHPLALGLKCACKSPLCQTLEHTALPRTVTTPHKQPERKDKGGRMYENMTGYRGWKGLNGNYWHTVLTKINWPF